ncbi:ACT domain-containing protein [Alkalibacter mobilis]|uniref:ACT domain-containing protein n=1 Tax=Alkalibacter mobilis TaxID=2787712 RepID=UPI00189FEA89|nr:ACT domain-containing protein [Alkalibacter mobilis]MBF7096866.1 ACT domain-containing protein [Alkalibacter mobilis]
MKVIITVIGKDKPGIIFNVSKILFENSVNIEDISQTIMQDYFTMMMLADMSNASSDFNSVKSLLEKAGEDIGVSIKIQRQEFFESMHNI